MQRIKLLNKVIISDLVEILGIKKNTLYNHIRNKMLGSLVKDDIANCYYAEIEDLPEIIQLLYPKITTLQMRKIIRSCIDKIKDRIKMNSPLIRKKMNIERWVKKLKERREGIKKRKEEIEKQEETTIKKQRELIREQKKRIREQRDEIKKQEKKIERQKKKIERQKKKIEKQEEKINEIKKERRELKKNIESQEKRIRNQEEKIERLKKKVRDAYNRN